MFDGAIYETKRAEYHASVIKSLKKIKKLNQSAKDVKVDLLCYTSYYGDIFSCEDKADDATDAQVDVDVNKLTNLRVKILQYWREILPIPTAINQLKP
jgi:hypothetical protein